MATTDLSSKSLGDISLQSGNGTPNHISPTGSLYTDKDSGILYQNKNGSTAWSPMSSAAYAEGFYQNNTTQTIISASNTWTSVENNFTLSVAVGLSASTSTLVLISGYDGIYEVKGSVTIGFVVGTNNYEVGLSVNGANPANGTYGGALIDSIHTTQSISFNTILSLSGGTNLKLAVRNLTSGNNVIIRHAQLHIRKVN